MSYPANVISGAYTSNSGTSALPLGTIVVQANPSSSTLNGPLGPYKLGQHLLNEVSGALFYLANLTTSAGITSATWSLLGSSTGDVSSLTTQDSTIVLPTAGNINLSGHSGQLTTTGSGSTATIALTNAVTAPGSLATTTTLASGTTLTAGTGLTVTTGGATITAGGLTVTAGGAGITGTTNINTTGAAVSTIGTGGTGAVHIGNATGNTAVTGSLTASTGLTATTGNITASAGYLISAPTVSSAVTTAFGASLTVGTPVQNTTGYDILVNVAVTVSSSTTATLTLGVGTSATPTTDTAVPSCTVAASTVFTLVAYVPNNYYLSVGSTGTITVTSATVVAMGI